MITYGEFLKKNILIKRIKDLDTINVKINKYGTKVLFKRKDKNSIDINITDKKYFYREKFKYFINEKEQKEELRVFAYDSVCQILSLYFKKYSILIRWLRKLVSKK